jgi:hypothetical protein
MVPKWTFHSPKVDDAQISCPGLFDGSLTLSHEVGRNATSGFRLTMGKVSVYQRYQLDDYFGPW